MKGQVIKSTGSWYRLLLEDKEEVEARIKGKFRLQGIDTTNPIAVGDFVNVEKGKDDEYVIDEIMDRTNVIVRKSIKKSKRAHILASNVDLSLLVVTLKSPETSFGFIDRYLVAAESFRIPTVIVLNKVDLFKSTEALDYVQQIYEDAGYPVLRTSTKNGVGLEELKGLLQNKTTIISGHSGVGKSSLLNVIDPLLDVKIGAISDQHAKGKHTTTFAEMHPLSFGGSIIDTPGVKGFGLVDIEKEHLAHYFPELRNYLNQCKFHNCVHVNEPGCAVKQAFEEGEIHPTRMESYYKLYEGDDNEDYR